MVNNCSGKDDFFLGKRPWSLLKDQILKHYLPPYLKKVKFLNKNILIIDGFAGPGVFDDNSEGSPIFICDIAEENVPFRYKAFLVNKDPEHHEILTNHLKNCIDQGVAITLNSTAEEALKRIFDIIDDQTVFVYLDQFGISGFNYADILPYLKRDKRFSTELLLNINVSAIHRLSAKSQYEKDTPQIRGKHHSLSESLGGDYWKKYLFNERLSCDQQIFGAINEYKSLLQKDIEYVGYCPVYERGPGSVLKYFLIFASRHIDTVVLLNNIMFDAYYKHIWNCNYKQTLFEDDYMDLSLPPNYYSDLKQKILEIIESEKLSRIRIWHKIIISDFMKFKESDFKKAVKELYDNNKISFIDVKNTGKLNDDSILYLKQTNGTN